MFLTEEVTELYCKTIIFVVLVQHVLILYGDVRVGRKRFQPLELIANDWPSRSGAEKLICTTTGISELWCLILDFQLFDWLI
jgi:hypothetical protein